MAGAEKSSKDKDAIGAAAKAVTKRAHRAQVSQAAVLDEDSASSSDYDAVGMVCMVQKKKEGTSSAVAMAGNLLQASFGHLCKCTDNW